MRSRWRRAVRLFGTSRARQWQGGTYCSEEWHARARDQSAFAQDEAQALAARGRTQQGQRTVQPRPQQAPPRSPAQPRRWSVCCRRHPRRRRQHHPHHSLAGCAGPPASQSGPPLAQSPPAAPSCRRRHRHALLIGHVQPKRRRAAASKRGAHASAACAAGESPARTRGGASLPLLPRSFPSAGGFLPHLPDPDPLPGLPPSSKPPRLAPPLSLVGFGGGAAAFSQAPSVSDRPSGLPAGIAFSAGGTACCGGGPALRQDSAASALFRIGAFSSPRLHPQHHRSRAPDRGDRLPCSTKGPDQKGQEPDAAGSCQQPGI